MKRHRNQLKVFVVVSLELRNPTTGASVEKPATNWQPAIQNVAPVMSLDHVEISSLQDEFQWHLIEDDAPKYTRRY